MNNTVTTFTDKTDKAIIKPSITTDNFLFQILENQQHSEYVTSQTPIDA
jgi:hypothetical protein